MNRLKYLLKNIGIMAIGQFGTKLIGFVMLPLYTSILSTREYGIYDLLSVTVSLLLPIVTVTVYEATLRFAMDERKDIKDVFITSNVVLLIGDTVVAVGLIINYFLGLNTLIKEYSLLLFLMLLLDSISYNLSNFVRGLDKVKEVAVSGIISSVVVVVSNILFLIVLRWGITGFFVSGILGVVSQLLYLFFSGSCYQYIRGKNDKKLRREMLGYSWPLVANNVASWITIASDRYVVTWICGLSISGIYSVGYKIPSILVVFQSIFNQAWVLSAVKEFDSKDKEAYFTKVYRLYNFGMVVGCSVLILSTKVLAYYLYSEDFYQAWVYVPLLVISIVFGSLCSYVGGIFLAAKDTGIIAKTTLIGATLNIIVDIALVYSIGAMGAAIATVLSYIVIWMMRMIYVRKYIKLEIKILRDVFSYLLLIVQTVILLIVPDYAILYPVEMVLLLVIIGAYMDEIKIVMNRMTGILK